MSSHQINIESETRGTGIDLKSTVYNLFTELYFKNFKVPLIIKSVGKYEMTTEKTIFKGEHVIMDIVWDSST